MYSSGKDLHLDLLGNSVNGTLSNYWEIPPYEVKAVMKATFYSKEEGILNRFVRVKLGAPASSSDVVIIPFEMIVSNSKSFFLLLFIIFYSLFFPWNYEIIIISIFSIF